MNNIPTISVIIRVKNEERWIGHCIQSILDNINQPEIILIDNNSTDITIDIVKHFKRDKNLENLAGKSYTNIKTYSINDYTPGLALNYGLKKITSELVLIISAHCVIKKFDSDSVISNLRNHECVFGNQIPVWEGKRIKKRYIWSHFNNEKTVNKFSKLENRYFLHNAFAIYKKKTLIEYPFDEELVNKEDRYWADLIVKKNKTYIYDPSLVVEHHYTQNGNTWKGLA